MNFIPQIIFVLWTYISLLLLTPLSPSLWSWEIWMCGPQGKKINEVIREWSRKKGLKKAFPHTDDSSPWDKTNVLPQVTKANKTKIKSFSFSLCLSHSYTHHSKVTMKITCSWIARFNRGRPMINFTLWNVKALISSRLKSYLWRTDTMVLRHWFGDSEWGLWTKISERTDSFVTSLTSLVWYSVSKKAYCVWNTDPVFNTVGPKWKERRKDFLTGWP